MSIWIKYRLGWYDLLAYPSYIANGALNQWGRIREFGLGKWLFSLALMGVLGWTLVAAVIQGLGLSILQIYVASVTTAWAYLQSVILMVVMIIAFDRMQRLHPVMKSSVINVFARGRQSSIDNLVLWPAHAPLIGAVGLVLLILTVPFYATLEELIFRELPNPFMDKFLPPILTEFIAGSGVVGVVLWSVLAFGMVHLYSGSRVGDCLALGLVGGSVFALHYALNGLHVAIISHANYNLVAIAFMTSPICQRIVTTAINTGLEANGRAPLAKSRMEYVSSLKVKRTPRI